MTLDLSRPELSGNGGNPLRNKPWLDNFTIGAEERQAALRALDSGYRSLFEGSYSPNHPFSFYGSPEVQGLEYEWSQYYEC